MKKKCVGGYHEIYFKIYLLDRRYPLVNKIVLSPSASQEEKIFEG